MTLLDTVRIIEASAMKLNTINMIVENDVFKLNGYTDARYGVFAFTQGQHRYHHDEGLMELNFTLYYIDRLTDDHRNQLACQSTGISTLTTLIRRLQLSDLDITSNVLYQPFNEKFEDDCAGVYCDVRIMIPIDIDCEVAVKGYADYNNDFNKDFQII